MIAANFTKSQKSITVESVTQGDYGQKLSIHGLSLPSSVEVHFVAAGEQEGIKMFGTTQAEETVVEIPNLLIAKGKDLTAYIFVCDSMEGKTVRTIRIPVHRKPEVEEIELPPDEQDIVRELMGLVNGFESEIDKLDEKKADKTMVGTPLVADSIQDMRDVEKIYVYVGSGTGELIPGNWYYWDGNYWVSGGVYNAAALGEGSVTTGKLADQSVTYEKLAAEVVELEYASEIVSMHYASNCDPVNRGFEVVDVAYVPEMQTARVEFTNLEHGETEPFKYALGIKMEYISGESTIKEDTKNIQVSGEGFSEPYVLFEDIPDGYDHMKLYIIIDYSHSVSPSGVQLSRIEFDIKATKKERQKAIFPIMELRPGNVPPGIITTANLKEESVTEEKIGSSSVSGRCIVDRAITEAKLGDLAVSERCIADGAVTEAKLGDLAVSERCMIDNAVTPDKLDRLYKEITLTEKTTGTFFDISKEARKVVIGFENKMVDDHLYACRKNIWNLKKQDGIIMGKNAAVQSQIVYSVVEDGAIYLRGQWLEDPVYIPLGIEYQAEMLLGKKLHVAMFNVYGAIPYGISFHMGMNVSGESVLSNHTMMNHIGEVQETIDEEGRLCLRIEKGLDLQQEIGIGLLCEIISDDSEASMEFTNGEKKEILNQKAITPDRKTWIFTKNGSTIYKAIPEDEQPPEFILLKSEAGTTFRIRVTDAGELSIEADR